MKKIARGYLMLALLLLIWAVADLLQYLGVQTETSPFAAEGLFWRLVTNRLFWMAAKVLVAGLLLLLGWRRKKNPKPRRSLAAITALLALAVLGVWGACLYCLTSVTAQRAAERDLVAYGDYASEISTVWLEDTVLMGEDLRHENFDAYQLWRAAARAGRAWRLFAGSPYAEGDSGFLSLPEGGEVCATLAVFDGSGELIAGSWEDCIFFWHLTPAQWEAEGVSPGCAVAPLDRTKLTPEAEQMLEDGDLTFDAIALRFTGSYDGAKFTAQRIEAIGWNDYFAAMGSGKTMAQVIEVNDLAWIALYENPDASVPAGEQTTFYATQFEACYRPQASPAFVYDGSRCESVDALALTLGAEYASGWPPRYEGLNLIIPSFSTCLNLDGEPTYIRHGPPEESASVYFYTVSVVWCSPWRTAMAQLREVYLWTFLLAVGLILLAHLVIRRNLIVPLRWAVRVLNGQAEGHPRRLSQSWRESRALQQGVAAGQETFRRQRDEITRLNTALSYAETAEQARRQMTSNLAHELKTPLAVIHGYAEGLKEHIAEEKREKYLDVILSETERTDALVLQLLDLSRLEAGKVRLSREDFSITALTRAVFARLQLAIKEKQLRLTLDFPEELRVTADESRLGQVIENFATNAVKYSPPGGRIVVTIHRNDFGSTSFAIENESPPLSAEALEKVWDTFYRADAARSGGGTGLGLAIAKSIIELHGGHCSVRNTGSGVRFGFVI